MFPTRGFLYAPQASTHPEQQVSSSRKLEALARRHGQRLDIQFFFLSEPTGSEFTGSEFTGSEFTGSESTGSESTGSESTGSECTGSEWKCACSVNGVIRVTVDGKTSRQDAKEAAAEAALKYLRQQGYE